VVFVVVNNKWAISVPLSIQTATETLAQKAIAAGIPGIQIDGNDVIAVRQAMEESLSRARTGKGATLVEAVTYRLSDHTTADDASRYRKNEEVEQARHLEPLIRLRRYLTELGVWDEAREEELLADCQRQVEEAVETYLNTPVQAAGAMFDFMFEEPPAALADQRENALLYEPERGDH
jgi:pyruvate dehydrogenase E1 component alpha subunit